MYLNIVQLILLVCIGHAVIGSPIDDAINELRPEVQKAKTGIEEALANSGIELNNANIEIGQTIHSARTTLDAKLHELDQEVKEAQSSGKPAQPCLEKVKIQKAQLDFDTVSNCRANGDLDVAGLKMAKLRIAKASVSKLIAICTARNPLVVESLKECVRSQLRATDSYVKTVQNELQVSINQAKKVTATCVEDAVEKLQNNINSIIKDLKTCVDNL